MFTDDLFFMWYLLPLYIGNAVPMMIWYLRHHSRNRLWKHEKPIYESIFGPHRTRFGIASIIIVNALVAFLMGLPTERGLVLGLGASAGVLASSLVKRSSGLRPGESFPVLDQLDFLLGAQAAYSLAFGGLPNIYMACMVTLAFHVLSSLIAYKAGLREEPV